MEPLIIFQDIMTIMIRSVFQVENRWHTENGLLREFHPFVYTEIICKDEESVLSQCALNVKSSLVKSEYIYIYIYLSAKEKIGIFIRHMIAHVGHSIVKAA